MHTHCHALNHRLHVRFHQDAKILWTVATSNVFGLPSLGLCVDFCWGGGDLGHFASDLSEAPLTWEGSVFRGYETVKKLVLEWCREIGVEGVGFDWQTVLRSACCCRLQAWPRKEDRKKKKIIDGQIQSISPTYGTDMWRCPWRGRCHLAFGHRRPRHRHQREGDRYYGRLCTSFSLGEWLRLMDGNGTNDQDEKR